MHSAALGSDVVRGLSEVRERWRFKDRRPRVATPACVAELASYAGGLGAFDRFVDSVTTDADRAAADAVAVARRPPADRLARRSRKPAQFIDASLTLTLRRPS